MQNAAANLEQDSGSSRVVAEVVTMADIRWRGGVLLSSKDKNE